MNVNKRSAELKALDEKSFEVTEWVLYLDTHPGDVRAFSACRRAMNEYNAAHEAFVNNYGPLSARDGAGKAWIADPWPWDYEEGGC